MRCRGADILRGVTKLPKRRAQSGCAQPPAELVPGAEVLGEAEALVHCPAPCRARRTQGWTPRSATAARRCRRCLSYVTYHKGTEQSHATMDYNEGKYKHKAPADKYYAASAHTTCNIRYNSDGILQNERVNRVRYNKLHPRRISSDHNQFIIPA